jgi:hypothetical protein
MLQKIKNFFRPRRKSVRTLDKLSIAERQRYKSLIPNLFGEFIEEIPLEKKRSNSLNKNYNKLTLDLDPLKYSISGEIIKKKIQNQNNANFRPSLQRNYFIGSLQKTSRILTSKNVRRGSFEDKIVLNKKENIGKSITIQTNNIENENPNFFQRSLKKKKTIDPQDTETAAHLSFKLSQKEIKETKEKLEEYQGKMRKTQLRYYVFKKITNYKSSLRNAFNKYRSIVQLMEALDEKDDIKETQKGKEGENDIELLKKRINTLKNVLKNRSFREQKELNKYFIKFYYNSKFAVKIENLNKTSSDNAIISTSNATENSNSNTNANNDNFLDVLSNEIKKEEQKKELTPEEIEKEKRKRNKELRDLFYNKIRERKKWLHDHFVKFYYKGLLWAMKTGNIKNNTSSPSSNDTSNTTTNNNNSDNATSSVNNENVIQNTTTTTDQSAEINLDNKTSSEIDMININKEIEKKEEERKEEKKEEKKDENNDQKAKVRNLRDRSKGLRRLLSERNKEKTNLLRKYFFKFLSNGILLSLKKTTLRSTKSLIQVDVEGENSENKSEGKKVEEESNWIIEEKKRRKQEEEQKERELKEKINKKLVVIFNKKDLILCSRLRSCLQRWNLRAKIMGISDLTGGVRRSKRLKGKKKNKKKEDKKNEEKKEENNENNEDN